jgi:TIGR03009 family protein
LNAQQQAVLDQILTRWEAQSSKIRTFRCPFERWEYDPVFMEDGARKPVTKSWGQLKYAKPDKGLFRVAEVHRYDPQTNGWTRSNEPGEHWVCDGEAVYEFNTAKKQLIVRQLPPEYRGHAIAEGPLPFLFSAEAEKLKRRYYLRVAETTETEIWLDAYPRQQRDAANFRRVELILDRHRFLPSAIQVHLPNGKSRVVYMFRPEEAKINDPVELFLGVFEQPRTPWGWKRIVEPVPSTPSGAQAKRTAREPSPAARH